MTNFSGRSILITGGAGAIGVATAEAFLRLGAKVALVDISQDALDAKKADLSPLGEVIAIQANVTDEADVARYVAETVSAFGTIDVFFNNAGIEGKVAAIVDTPIENLDSVLAVNVRGAFLGLKHVLPIMTKRGSGSIINTSSVSGLSGTPNLSPYVTSKHALVGLMKVAALEAAPSNVRVNSVHPSPVNTRMMRSLEAGFNPDDAEGAQAAFAKAIPLGRYGEAADIANLVVFLGSDESAFITGAQYRVDGGMGAL
ncbi:SDR family oxidoreductase [Cryobacterium melibiosiphilum]|uniref:SDR family oxidoreductase n=1 Tax=Cryobacterium melibiosiphilum TaxID=995039 RepID=A0A3A5N2C8_9MICO|nr:SDR family NAD(P)-dependent oxidoreductase [Cryobacterium melibiosiphilum]RJT92456.1 SDR family oxidoreductase [Cryobacterium melibiosiphilum]